MDEVGAVRLCQANDALRATATGARQSDIDRLCAQLLDPKARLDLHTIYVALDPASMSATEGAASAIAAPTATVLDATVDRAIRGLAAFVASRLEQEAIVSVFSVLQSEVCTHSARRRWVENLCALELESVLGAGSALAGVVRDAVTADITALPTTLVSLAQRASVKLPKVIPDALPKNPALLAIAHLDTENNQLEVDGRAAIQEVLALKAELEKAGLTDAATKLITEFRERTDHYLPLRIAAEISRESIRGKDLLYVLGALADAYLGDYCLASSTGCEQVFTLITNAGKIARAAAIAIRQIQGTSPVELDLRDPCDSWSARRRNVVA